MAARLAPGDGLIGYCALTHDLGKALTPKEQLPRHIAHENTGVTPVRALSARLKVPTEYATMAVLCCRLHLQVHQALELRPETILKLFEQLDSFRKPERLSILLRVCEIDKRGRLGKSESDYPPALFLQKAYVAATNVAATPFIADGAQGKDIGEYVRKARIAAIKKSIT